MLLAPLEMELRVRVWGRGRAVREVVEDVLRGCVPKRGRGGFDVAFEGAGLVVRVDWLEGRGLEAAVL